MRGVVEAIRGRRRILQEGVWVGIGQASTALALTVGIRVLTEYVSPDVYGNLSRLLALFYLMRNVFTVSISQAALRFYGELAPIGGMGRLRKSVSRLLARVFTAPVLGILAIGAFAALLHGSAYLPYALLAALLVADVARTYEATFLIAARRQRDASILDIMDSISRPALAVGAILVLGAGVEIVLLAYVVSAFLTWLGARFALEREGTGSGVPPDPALERDLLRFAAPLMPMAAVMWVTSLSDRYIIGAIAGDDQVGLYAAAYGLISQPFLMAQALLERTLSPPYYLAVAAGDRRKERQTLRAQMAGTLAICAAGLAIAWIFPTLIARIFLAASYRESAALMPPIALGNALLAMQYVFSKPLYAHKRTRELLAIYSFGAVASAVITVPMVMAFGVRGAAYACPIYYALQLIVMVYRAREATWHPDGDPLIPPSAP